VIAQPLERASSQTATAAVHGCAVERVLATMRERLDEDLTLHDMADVAHLSPYHFTRVFRHVTGIPPCEFLTALRLQEAKRLLLTTGLSVTDVCFEVGYSSLGTFTTRFTHLIGVSPGRLRRLAEAGATPRAEPLRHHDAHAANVVPINAGVTGRIKALDAPPGPIFIGLFPTPLPQSCPVACTRLTAPGVYRIAPVPDGRYHVLTAALPWSSDLVGYLLPDARLRVGIGQGPIVVHRGRAHGVADVTLRPLQPTDPPLLTAHPFLTV
jgi:AraC family transcriptional regulator